MKRRRPLPPDTRPSWRDPNCPVIGKSGRLINYHKMKQHAQVMMIAADLPNWRNDPTYNLRRKS